MARKDLLKGLMDEPDTSPAPSARVNTAKPRYTKGAIDLADTTAQRKG